MIKIFTKLSAIAFFLAVFQTSFAQLSVTGQASGLKFLGDVGQKSNSNFFSDMRLGYNFGVEYRIGKVLGIGLDGIYGKLQGTDNDKDAHKNFQTQITGGGLNLYAFFDKLGEKEKEVAPYIHAGFGYLMFDPKTDLIDKNGTKYVYWADGSIRNVTEAPSNTTISTVIKRDYKYETTVKDTAVSFAKNTFYVPLGVGAKFQMGFRASLRVGLSYNLVMTDYLDGYKKGGNDSWAGASVGLNFHFGKKPKDPYSNVDFKAVDNSDTDNDGVKDVDDRCFGTPKGIKVDGKGCPEDKDDDGVFDYMDKELTTKKGVKVDGDGVTIDEGAMAKRQLQWDSLSVERSEGFNNAPSLAYLQSVENKAKETAVKTDSASKIPADFKPADFNNDGYISANEITKAIDGFFEGDSPFTVEKINKLIDYFFEQ